jgi:competence protein ComEC
MDRYPAVRLFLSMSAGILIGHALNIPVLFCWTALAAAATAALVWRRSNASDWLWLILMACSGCLWYQARSLSGSAPAGIGPIELQVLVTSEPRLTKGRWAFTGKVESAGDRPSRLRAAVYLTEDAGLAPEYGDRLKLSGNWRKPSPARNPGGFDYREYLEHQEVSGVLSAGQAQLLDRAGGNRITSGLVIPSRRYLRDLTSRYLKGDEAALMLGLLLGERQDLSQPVKDAFSDTGTTHVLAVSGLHVVLVAFIIFLVLRASQLPKRWAAGGTMAGLVFYTLLTGSPPSIVRATIMSSAVIVGTMFERQGSGLNMLGLSGLAILAFWPPALFDVGFQLSYAATFGILTLTRPIQGLLSRITPQPQVNEWLLMPLAVSAAAQLATTPLLALHFHRIPLVSLAANLAVVPLTNMLLALGLSMALLNLASPWLAAPLAAAAYAVGWITLRLVEMFSKWSWATVAWPRPEAIQISAYLLALLLAFRWTRLGSWRKVALAGMLLSANAVVWSRALARPAGLEVFFLDVGQGDAAVVRFPNGHIMAIDAGNGGAGQGGRAVYDYGRNAVVPFLRFMGAGKIDRFLVTHADADHCGGLASVLKAVKVERLTTTRHWCDKTLYQEALAIAAARGTRVDSLCGYDTLEGIWPVRGFVYSRPDTVDNGNETSLVCYLEYGDRSFFFTGDMGPELQGHLVRQGLLPRCTVLKVPHHGAGHNNGPGLAEAVRPETAVISVGEFNRFGHPSPQAVENYSKIGTRIMRTDLGGAVTVRCDGEGFRVSSMLGGTN